MKDTRSYLDYLDKEMTILGILSAACIAVPVFMLDKLAGALVESGLGRTWSHFGTALKLSSLYLAIGALLFFKQRSLLAWFYGQIAINVSPAADEDSEAETIDLIEGADAWSTWTWYSLGFDCLILGVVVFALAVSGLGASWLNTAALLAAVPTALVAGLQTFVFCRHAREKDPWAKVFPWLARLRFKCQS